MRAMSWLIPLTLLMACGEKEGDDSGAADDSASSDDSGTDDSGADDSGSTGPNGRYEGAAVFDVQDLNSGQTDVCQGELVVEVDMDNPNEQFFGEFQCSFTGFLSDFSPMQGSVYGLISDFGELAASYETGDGPIQGEWSGTFDETEGFYGNFEGSGSAMDLNLAWQGNFQASR
ncbi:MAG: hypothetical protein H6741_20835 [Alphaproteobacteria bacterium]|nr:hypothetical protein [Alphaproteobacteria bacterium]